MEKMRVSFEYKTQLFCLCLQGASPMYLEVLVNFSDCLKAFMKTFL